MPSVKRRASKILNEYGAARSELIGKAVVLTDGKAGTVENVWLDELHGLRISLKRHDGRLTVSTIKFTEIYTFASASRSPKRAILPDHSNPDDKSEHGQNMDGR